MSKIVDMPELLRRAEAARAAGRTIVHCHGCFDIVHPGHIRYLEFARRQGDLLIASLTGDSQITKGPQRPYIPEELRAENLAALQAVDLVYVDPHDTAAELLAALKPDVYVKGREYEQSTDPGFTAEKAVVAGYGGRVLFSSGDVVFSSTRLIESLAPDQGLEVEKLTALCRRHGIDRGSVGSLLSSFSRLRVLVVGDVILDRYVLCDATDLAAEAPMMSLTRLEEQTYVGGAGIVARHVAGLGATAYLLSTAADDEPSRMARQVFESEAVQANLIPCRSRLPDKTRYLVESTKLLRVDEAASHPLDSVAEGQAARWVESIAEGIDAVIFCEYGYGAITTGLLRRMQELLGDRPRVQTADVSGPRGRLLDFRGLDLLCPTERELRSALHDFESGLSTVAWNTLDQTASRHVIVTLGKRGVVVFDRQSQDRHSAEWRGRLRSEHLPALADSAVDPLGGGDALLAMSTLAIAAGGTLMQSAYLGSAAAAIEISRFGNVPIDRKTVWRWLSGRPELAFAVRRGPGPGTQPSVERQAAGFPASSANDVLEEVAVGAAGETAERRSGEAAGEYRPSPRRIPPPRGSGSVTSE